MKNILIGIAILVILALLLMKLLGTGFEGTWVAEHVIEGEQDTLNIDPSLIRLEIIDDAYLFHSTLNQTETGTFQHEGDYLIFQSETQATPYRVKVESKNANDLVLTMTAESTSRRLVMKRAQ